MKEGIQFVCFTEMLNRDNEVDRVVKIPVTSGGTVTRASAPYQKNVIEAFRTLQHAVHKNAVDHGWWDNPREDGTTIALMHCELSECVEALRNGNPPDEHCPQHGNAVIELADTVIRIMDYCERKGWNLGAAVVAKHEANKKRPYMHGGKEF